MLFGGLWCIPWEETSRPSLLAFTVDRLLRQPLLLPASTWQNPLPPFIFDFTPPPDEKSPIYQNWSFRTVLLESLSSWVLLSCPIWIWEWLWKLSTARECLCAPSYWEHHQCTLPPTRSSVNLHHNTLILSLANWLSTPGKEASKAAWIRVSHPFHGGRSLWFQSNRGYLRPRQRASVTTSKWDFDPEAQYPNQNDFSTIQSLALIKGKWNSGFITLFINFVALKGCIRELGAGKDRMYCCPHSLV